MKRHQLIGWGMIITVGIGAILAWQTYTHTHGDETWKRIQMDGVLRVGMDASFPPFEFIAPDGQLTGFEVDLALELGYRLGVEVQFVANLPYDGLYDALSIGRVDAVLSALVVNPARMTDFAYSVPYFDAGQVFIIREGEEMPTDAVAALDGYTLAVEFGSRGDQEARQWVRQFPHLRLLPYQTAQEALEAVADGRADVALVDHISALTGIANGLPLYIVNASQAIVPEPYAVAVRRDSTALLRAINDVLTDMEADNSLDELRTRWLGVRSRTIEDGEE